MNCKYCYKLIKRSFNFLSPCLCESDRNTHVTEKERLKYIKERKLSIKQTKRLNRLKRDNTENYKL